MLKSLLFTAQTAATTVRLLLWVSALLPAAAVTAENLVKGVIDYHARWTEQQSPYIIDDDLVVSRRARLVIAPGTRIVVSRSRPHQPTTKQFDRIDSSLISITVKGLLTCIGQPEKRIVFSPSPDNDREGSWFGIVFDSTASELCEIAYTDIAGAHCGITARGSSPLVRNTVIEYNTMGLRCIDRCNARIYNCVIVSNLLCGVKVEASNPTIFNTIITNNRNNGVCCDGISQIDFRYNCLFANGDGDLHDCDPEWGILRKINENKDSVDAWGNLYDDPIFAGSPADSVAAERDITLPTHPSRVTDSSLARIFHGQRADSLAALRRKENYPRYALSRYSPCINAGHPAKKFSDSDGSRNDIGIWGGPHFLGKEHTRY